MTTEIRGGEVSASHLTGVRSCSSCPARLWISLEHSSAVLNSGERKSAVGPGGWEMGFCQGGPSFGKGPVLFFFFKKQQSLTKEKKHFCLL